MLSTDQFNLIKNCLFTNWKDFEIFFQLSNYKEFVLTVFDKKNIYDICKFLKESKELCFSQLIDLCGVDYLHYKIDDRFLDEIDNDTLYKRFLCTSTINKSDPLARFCVIYNLLSLKLNCRLRIKVFVGNNTPIINSVSGIWSIADWYERESFDLFGIEFIGHKNLCRILTDYGFRDFPLRKDFSVVGNSMVFYDNKENKISYKENSIELRRVIPKVVRFGNLN